MEMGLTFQLIPFPIYNQFLFEVFSLVVIKIMLRCKKCGFLYDLEDYQNLMDRGIIRNPEEFKCFCEYEKGGKRKNL